MTLIIQIAWRFLLAKKRAMIMSLAGIVFGVAFFIVAQAQTSGFEEFFIDAVWGTNGALKVQDRYQNNVVTGMAASDEGGFSIKSREGQSYVEGVERPARIMAAVRKFSEVTGASEVVRGKAEISSGFRSDESEVFGIRLADHLSVSNLGSQIKHGDLSNFDRDPQAIIIGTIMAQRLHLDIGDTAILRHTNESRRYKVVGIFETGIEDYDKRRVFIHLREARELLDIHDKASFIQVSLADNNLADILAPQMREALQHDVRPWQESEKSWLEVFRVLRITSAITMSVIIVIAALGMFNTLAIIVMERRREIAILRSMGYSRHDVAGVFVAQGMIVLCVGMALGCAFAAILTIGVEHLPVHIKGMFTTNHLIVKWSAAHYMYACMVSTVVVFVASFLPARRAAKIEPGEIIRGAS